MSSWSGRQDSLDLQDIDKVVTVLLHESRESVHWRVSIMIVLAIESKLEEMASRVHTPRDFRAELQIQL